MAPGQESELVQPKATAEDRAEGQQIYGKQCSYCHGPKGEGGKGPVLAVRRLPRAPDDDTLFRIIRDGIPGTRMPANALTPSQIWQVIAYVRVLSRIVPSQSTGNARRGQQVYGTKGCGACHTVGGHGGGIGPDLTAIGARSSAAEILTSLLDPDASIPLSYLQVRVVTKNSQSLTGARVNEDSFSIQIRDLSNNLHSFWKSELKELVKEPKGSLMPSMRNKLTATELEDLVAYLESLEGDQ
jgi:putative heme-binding domain-containing protein